MEFKGDGWDRGVTVSISRKLHAVFKFTANKPTCLFFRCLLSSKTPVLTLKMFSRVTRWALGSFKQPQISFLFIFDSRSTKWNIS